MAFLTNHLVATGIFLFISGVGAGILQTLGPALATDAVQPQERGRAMASIGTLRAISLLVTPMGIGALVFILPSVAVATTIVAVAVGAPGIVAGAKLRPPTQD